jgi:acyl-CoA:acyl-CoA alkyltransferase
MRAAITGVGHYLPDRRVTTAEVEQILTGRGEFAIPSGLIQLLTGVRERYWASEDQASSDLAAAAGRAALDHAGVHPLSLDLLIVASASHDVAEPSTAAITQSKLGCKNAATMDVKSACNSFINGLDVAASMIETGRAASVLVTAGEVISPVIDWEIGGMAALKRKFAGLTLGDAGGAVVVQALSAGSASAPAGPDARGVLPGEFMTDGDQWELCTVLFGGSLKRMATGDMFDCRSDELAKLALQHLPDLFGKVLGRIGWDTSDIALVVPHQVSRAVIVDLARRWDYPLDRCMITIDRYGNTAAASIPLALSLAEQAGRISRGDKIMLVGGAAGFSAGIVPLVW